VKLGIAAGVFCGRVVDIIVGMRVQHAADERQCNDNGVLHSILHPVEMTYKYSVVRIFCRAGLAVRFKAPDYKLEMKQTALEFAERAVWRRCAQRPQ
jgi:hypothetical protein